MMTNGLSQGVDSKYSGNGICDFPDSILFRLEMFHDEYSIRFNFSRVNYVKN